MTQNQKNVWNHFRHFGARFTICYLLFYFLLLSDFYVSIFPFLETVHKPFKYISDNYVGLINRLIIKRDYDANVYTGIGDTSWFYMACLVYIVTALLAAMIWSLLCKRKQKNALFIILYTYSRYYLAFTLIVYGLAKLFETQFPELPPDYLIQPLGNLDSHTLLWAFMGASRSYNFFGGVLETVAGLFLLIRRTSVLGAILSLAIFTQVLFLDIGYDTLVKALVAHLILICIFILYPAVPSLWNFFVTKKGGRLPIPMTLAMKPANSWLRYVSKTLLIGIVVFSLLRQQAKISNDYSKSYYGGIDGIYETTKFIWNEQNRPPLTTDSIRWRRVAISKFGYLTVQFMNDSTAQYNLQVDTLRKIFELTSWKDTTFNSKLNYSITGHQECLLVGTFNENPIKVVMNKKGLKDLPLLKDKGKIRWVWW